MVQFKIGCEHYAWVMAGCIEPSDPYYDKLDHIVKVVDKAGFKGFEPIDKFLYSFYEADQLRECLASANMQLSSVVLLEDWLNPRETPAEKEAADKLINFLADYFPNTLLMPVQMPTSRDDSDLIERQDNLINCVNALSRRAAEKGVASSYHPNSPEESIWRTADDYERLLPMLDNKVVGWTPDVGHMAAGDMDPVQLMRDFREIINHVHYKDMNKDKSWALMGEGIIDFKTITMDLIETGYDGWIIVEDECDRAVNDPDGVTIECGEFMEDFLRSLPQSGEPS